LTEEKPPLPPRKRSGWGLGFKTGTAGGAGTASGTGGNATATGSSWTKGWGTSRSGTASPPALGGRKGSVDASSIGAEKISDEPISVADGLAAPLEIVPGNSDDVDQEDKKEVPLIQATDSSPIATTARTDAAPETTSPTDNEHLHPHIDADTGLKRADSNISLNSTNRSEKFTTPQSEHPDMLDEEGQKVPIESEAEATAPAEPEEKQPVIVGPPPVPKRAAARQRINGASVDVSREGSPIQEALASKPQEAGGASVVKEVDTAAGEEVTIPVAGEDTIAPPPLPARHPQTPKQNRQSRIEEKTYLKQGDEEDWESKTWRMIIKLKEDMWKTRVGVVDGEDD
jgi:hypothetical protein